MYLNSVQIIGFIGKDPERRQARGNGAAFTVFSAATQRSWKNADDEWASKTEWHGVVAWNSLGERVATSLHRAKSSMRRGIDQRLGGRYKDSERAARGGRPD